ncbi:MAG TPA: hypothetical protein VG722_02785 [Tepidisphaeraceae bacterium]|nr:hypothetical protein [Tepidisphaeraceae bacterium]
MLYANDSREWLPPGNKALWGGNGIKQIDLCNGDRPLSRPPDIEFKGQKSDELIAHHFSVDLAMANIWA